MCPKEYKTEVKSVKDGRQRPISAFCVIHKFETEQVKQLTLDTTQPAF